MAGYETVRGGVRSVTGLAAGREVPGRHTWAFGFVFMPFAAARGLRLSRRPWAQATSLEPIRAISWRCTRLHENVVAVAIYRYILDFVRGGSRSSSHRRSCRTSSRRPRRRRSCVVRLPDRLVLRFVTV